jgi:hypothetical protein
MIGNPGSNTKLEFRNSKLETNSNDLKAEIRNGTFGILNFDLALFRFCFGFRYSDFAFCLLGSRPTCWREQIR